MLYESTTKRLTLGGAVLAALAASSCCLVPLVLTALGLGGAGAFAALVAYRPYILGLTVVLLGAGFYLTYRKPCGVTGDQCRCERPRSSRAGKIGLWTATGIVVLFAASPYLIAKLYDARSTLSAAADPTAKIETAVLRVQGADCDACAAHMRAALTKLGGFRDLKLDLPSQSVTVSYESAPGRLDAYVAAINELGYEAKIEPARPRASR